MKTLLFLIALLASPAMLAAPVAVTATWDANPPDELVVQYVVQYWNAKDNQVFEAPTANLEVSVNLTPGNWTFIVYAVDNEGQRGPNSDAVAVLIEKPAPGKVKNAKVIKLPVQGSNDKIKWKDIGFVYPEKNWKHVRVKS